MAPIRLKDHHKRLIAYNFRLLDENADEQLDRRQTLLLFRGLGQTQPTAMLNNAINEFLKKKLEKTAPSATPSAVDNPPRKTMRHPQAAVRSSNGQLSAEDERLKAKLLSLDDFLAIFQANYQPPIDLPTLKEAFKMFDSEHRGVLPLTKLRELLTAPDSEPLQGDDLEMIMQLARKVSGSSETGEENDVVIDYAALAEALVDEVVG